MSTKVRSWHFAEADVSESAEYFHDPGLECVIQFRVMTVRDADPGLR